MMFTRFTRGAREVVVQAQAEARALGHHSVGTGPEHVLLALLDDDDAAAALRRAGVPPERVRTAASRRGRAA